MAEAGSDIVVLGAGIVGLSVARALARRGRSVTVLERGRVGEEASGAAAGIVSLMAEAQASPAAWPLAARALAGYEQLVAELHEESGIDAGFARRGFLMVALGPSEDEALSETMVKAARLGHRVAKISGDDTRALEPRLSRTVTSSLYSPADAQLDPRLLCAALAASCRKHAVVVREGCDVTALAGGAGDFAIATTTGEVRAARVVVAMGAWSGALADAGLEGAGIGPCRGQMLVFEKRPAALGPVVYRAGQGYLVSRADGRILAGSTLETGTWEKSLTAQGVSQLAKNTVALMPALGDATLIDSWAGFRPQSKDGAPVIGETRRAGVFACTGHFKSGILQGPVSAELLAELMETGVTPAEIVSLGPGRFAA